MKNRLLSIFVLTFVLFLCGTFFSACGNIVDNYTINYELNGGINNSENLTTYSSEMNTITLLEPTKTGYKFIKWTEGNVINAGSTGNKTFTAEWQIITYSISYNLVDGTNNDKNPTSYDVESEKITLQNPTKTGYKFIKWTEGNVINAGSTGNKTFTAEWQLCSYVVEYTLNGGTQNNSNISSFTIQSENITLFEPTFIGYIFGGWFENDEMTGDAVTFIPAGTNENKHFYAKWIDIFTRNGTVITGLTEKGRSLSEITIPIGFSSIADNSFKDNTKITKIVITAEVKSIGIGAFKGCTNLSAVILNEGLEEIGDSSFAECPFIRFTVPKSVTRIGDSVLGGCAKLTELTIPFTGEKVDAGEGVWNFGRIFGKTAYSSPEFVICQSYNANGTIASYYIPAGLKTVSFNSNITIIKGNSFRNCTTIENINMPDSVQEISNGAFYGCSKLKSFILPSALTLIGDSAFRDCASLTTLTASTNLQKINTHAFYGCTNLASVVFNEGLEEIKDSAFVQCLFSSFTVPSTVTRIGDSVLGGCANLTELTIPFTGEKVDAGEGACNFGRIFGKTAYSSPEFVICQSYNANGTIASYYVPAGLKTVSFNSNITIIKGNSFRNCTTIENINMPDTVQEIRNGAFYGCTNLKSFTLPTSLTSIGDTAFQDCTSVLELTLKSSCIIANLNKSGVFSMNRKIYVLADFLSSYQITYSENSAMFFAILE